MVVNTYTIEGWEIERHEVLLRRSRVLGGYLDGPDGKRVRIIRQEFPYDIGFWNNVVQCMGTANVCSILILTFIFVDRATGTRLAVAICGISFNGVWTVLGDEWVRRYL